MIFLTVGTQFPFDRLVKTVDDFVGSNGFDEEILAQIGDSTYQPQNFKAVASLDKHLFDKYLRESSCIISHAGMGTITMSLEHGKPLLVMPRRKIYGEVVNDHQVAIAKKFDELGHVLVVYEIADLPEKIKQLKTFVPRKREAQPKVVAKRIKCFIDEIIGG
ncbi:MAG: hypothetical protein KAJ52_00790 [Sedimentisphaerales bacterium]|nr:hypothetical protein [Sedimentisphaerales bacterium]